MRLYATTALAALAAAGLSMTAAAKDLDRAEIVALTDAYLAALAGKDPAKAPLADDVAFVENVTRMKPGEGLWATATGGPTAFSIHVPDVDQQQAGWVGMMEREGAPVMVAVRLKLEDGEIVEAEHIVAAVRDTTLVQTPRPGLVTEVAEDQRLPHDELARIGLTYYDALDDNDGSLSPFAPDCERHENGFITAGANAGPGPNADPEHPIARDCAGQLSSKSFIYIDRIENRRLVAADPATGLALGFSHFRHPFDNLPYEVIRMDGTTAERNKENMPYDPFDMPAAHVFKIGPEGQIHEIEAVGVTAPYNSPTGWEE